MTVDNFSKINNYIKENTASYIARLKEVVAIPSVSGEVGRRPDVFKMGEVKEGD